MNERIPQAMSPEEWDTFFSKGFQPARPGDEVFMKMNDADRYRLAALILTCHKQGFGPDDLGALITVSDILKEPARRGMPVSPVVKELAQKLFSIAQRIAALLQPMQAGLATGDGEIHEVHALYERGGEMPPLTELPTDEDVDTEDWQR